MKLLVGWTAGQLLERMGRVPVPWALGILRDVCLGLEAVHAFAIHRDIKPDNLHIDVDGVVRVLDLGAAKMHQWGLVTTGGFSLGTVAYMSPEQLAEPETIDARSDLFSVGLVLYQLVSGRHPFVQNEALGNKQLVGVAILNRAPRPLLEVAPWAPSYLGEIVERALAKEPGDRYTDASEMAMVLGSAVRRLEHDLGGIPPLSTLRERLSLPGSSGGPDGAPGTTRLGTEVLAAPGGAEAGRRTARVSPSAPPDEAVSAFAATEQVNGAEIRQAAERTSREIGARRETWRPSRPLPVPPEDAEQHARRAETERVPRVERSESLEGTPRGSRWVDVAERSDRVVINPAAMGRRKAWTKRVRAFLAVPRQRALGIGILLGWAVCGVHAWLHVTKRVSWPYGSERGPRTEEASGGPSEAASAAAAPAKVAPAEVAPAAAAPAEVAPTAEASALMPPGPAVASATRATPLPRVPRGTTPRKPSPAPRLPKVIE